jgi:hypothetical protein
MAERQLRSRGLVTEGETITNDSEYEQNDNEVGCSLSEIEVHVSEEDQRLPNNQDNNTEKSDDSVVVMFTKQLEKFMESVKKGFEDLQTKIHRDIVGYLSIWKTIT